MGTPMCGAWHKAVRLITVRWSRTRRQDTKTCTDTCADGAGASGTTAVGGGWTARALPRPAPPRAAREALDTTEGRKWIHTRLLDLEGMTMRSKSLSDVLDRENMSSCAGL